MTMIYQRLGPVLRNGVGPKTKHNEKVFFFPYAPIRGQWFFYGLGRYDGLRNVHPQLNQHVSNP